MEWLTGKRPEDAIQAALFDFDGTISTLRQGWEDVMEPMMTEMIAGGAPDEKITAMVREYIDESTGIQTIFQMKWLDEKVREYGRNKTPLDGPWAYKAEYNRRLMEIVDVRRGKLDKGTAKREDFMMAGSEALLARLREAGVKLYVASGTDDPDVRAEVDALGLTGYFTRISGAPLGQEDCSKEKVMRQLMEDEGVPGSRLAAIGDGKVEIAIGRERGARTVGVASDEIARRGVNPVKRDRLIKAGADVIVGDFCELEALADFLLGS